MWDIISSCWQQDASERPPMISVCERLKGTGVDGERTHTAGKDSGRHKISRYGPVPGLRASASG
jgi:hypothetical protein